MEIDAIKMSFSLLVREKTKTAPRDGADGGISGAQLDSIYKESKDSLNEYLGSIDSDYFIKDAWVCWGGHDGTCNCVSHNRYGVTIVTPDGEEYEF